jgi:hypothetical protein
MLFHGQQTSLSEHLHVVLEMPSYSRPQPMKPTSVVCHKCREPIARRALFPQIAGQLQRDKQTLLKCACLAVIVGEPLEPEEVLTNWREFRRLKARCERELAPPEGN